MRGIRSRMAAIALAFGLAACDAVPADQVQFYADSYARANDAGNRLYDELVEPIRASETDAGGTVPQAPVPPPAYPAKFVPADFVAADPGGLQRPGEPESIAVRRAAMKTVADYNAIMVRLASGQTAAELSQQIDGLVGQLDGLLGLASLANPLTLPITESIGRLAGMAEALRADSELRAALIAGQEPMNALLDTLREDTARMYDVYLPYHRSQLVGRKGEVNSISRTIVEFVASYKRPGGDLAASLGELERRFAAAVREIPGLAERSLATRASGRAYDQSADESLKLMVDQFESVVAAHQAKVAEINAYYEALGVYVRLLDQVKRANAGLVDAAQRRTVTLDPVKVMTTATAIREDAETILAGL